MKRGTSSRSYNSSSSSSSLNNINFIELNTLGSIKERLRITVHEYLDKKSDRDSTLATLSEISKQVKTKLSTIS
jgi:hypothetical protein